MDLDLSDAERAFQAELRAFVREHLPAATRRKVLGGLTLEKADYVGWQQILHRRGWFPFNWPTEHGGPGWDPIQRFLFEEEMEMGGAPRLAPFGIRMVGPVIMEFGTPEQKARHLPAIVGSDVWWCQGYSEPGAGSDLAALQTRAVRQGDHYVVTGQKTWTTFAHYADWMFCLVRTDPAAKKQEGISFLLIDMKSPGITVRPIIALEGSHEINDVFLDDVLVPVGNRIAEENQGWTCAKFLLGHERIGIARVAFSKQQLARLKSIALREQKDGAPLLADPRFRARIAEVEIELLALEHAVLRILSEEKAGRPPGAEASFLKMRGTEIQQALTELQMKAVGWYGLPFVPEAMHAGWNEEPIGPDYAAPLAAAYFLTRRATIYGGSNEIQRNIIAKAVLGL